jgi:tetratricopeptide (TPR) repeat protein
MSIIHEALKKAEREREPVSPRLLPLYSANRVAQWRWKGIVTAGLLVSATTLGVFGAWTWWSRPPSALVMVPLPVAPASERRPADLPPREGEHSAMDMSHRPEDMSRTWQDATPASTGPEAYQTAESVFAEARQAEADGQWEEAIRHYRQATLLNPLLLEARNNLGKLLIQQRQIEAAIVELRAVLAVDSNYVLARNNLGSAYLLNGEEARAVQEFLTAVHIDRTYVSPYYNLALLHAKRGDVDQSVAFLTKALAIEPAVLSWVQDEPEFDGIRGAPAFQHLRIQSQARR